MVPGIWSVPGTGLMFQLPGLPGSQTQSPIRTDQKDESGGQCVNFIFKEHITCSVESLPQSVLFLFYLFTENIYFNERLGNHDETLQ